MNPVFAQCLEKTVCHDRLQGNLKKIGDHAFAANTTLESIRLPYGLEEIEQGAFYYSFIRDITVPATVSKIGDEAFGVPFNAPLQMVNGSDNIYFCFMFESEQDEDLLKIIDYCNEKLDYYVKDTDSVDSEVADELEDFIDYDYKLSDEVQAKVKTLNQILKANNHIFRSFREYLLSFKTKNHSSNNNVYGKINGNLKVKRISRNATSDEKSFARIVNNIAKDMINKTNSNKLDFTNYIQCVVSLFETYNKFIIRENVLGMFEERKVIDIQYNLIKELTSKFNNNITEEEKEMYLWLALSCILQIYYINTTGDKVDYKKNLSNRDLLKQIDERFNIRESYDEYLEVSLGFINQTGERIDRTIAKGYIESLFDYRTESQINNLMDKNFGKNYTVENNTGIITIKIKSNKIGDYFKLNGPIIKEILKTYCTDKLFQMLKIEVINININPNFPDPPIRIEYILNRNGNGQQTIVPKVSEPRVRPYSIR